MNDVLGSDLVQIGMSTLGALWWLMAAMAIHVLRQTDQRLVAEDGNIVGPRFVRQRRVMRFVRPCLLNRLGWSKFSLAATGLGLLVLGACVLLVGVDDPYRNVYGEFALVSGLLTLMGALQTGAGLAFFRMEFDAAKLQREEYEEYLKRRLRRWVDPDGIVSFFVTLFWVVLGMTWVTACARTYYVIFGTV